MNFLCYEATPHPIVLRILVPNDLLCRRRHSLRLMSRLEINEVEIPSKKALVADARAKYLTSGRAHNRLAKRQGSDPYTRGRLQKIRNSHPDFASTSTLPVMSSKRASLKGALEDNEGDSIGKGVVLAGQTNRARTGWVALVQAEKYRSTQVRTTLPKDRSRLQAVVTTVRADSAPL